MSEKDDTIPTVQPVVDGGAAFPTPLDGQVTRYDKLGNVDILHPGMSLRDYFAAKAMQAALGNQSMLDKLRARSGGDLEKTHEWLAEGAYLVADVMLKERGK